MVARELLLQGAKVDVATGWRGCCRYRVARVLLLEGGEVAAAPSSVAG